MSDFLQTYHQHVKTRAAEGVAPLPLSAEQTAQLVELLKNPPADNTDELLTLFKTRIPAGVDDATYVKASFLSALAAGDVSSPLISNVEAVEILGTMQGGYNIEPLIKALDNDALAPTAAKALSHTLLMFDSFHDVDEMAKAGN
ncbi:MAG: aconitate hydratase B, partial [Gammaproteobacteria bacterium]